MSIYGHVHMASLHISSKFLLNVSIGFHDMSILITLRVPIWIESQINMLLKWPKYCARRMKKISISHLNWFLAASLELI